VEHAAVSPLTAWANFYVIVGSSAAALTGLQFVVLALIAESPRRGTMAEIRAFGTPTIVLFSGVLLVSAILSAPWSVLASAAAALVACGTAGTVYALVIIRRTRRQTGYKPVVEDWLWHCALPLAAYAAVLAAAMMVRRFPGPSLFTIGAAVILLLFIGIHNSWDTVTFIVMEDRTAGKNDS
jgi:hypothetical protein